MTLSTHFFSYRNPAASLLAAQWGVPYSATVAVAKPDGATVSGLPSGLIGTVSSGILTVAGTPL